VPASRRRCLGGFSSEVQPLIERLFPRFSGARHQQPRPHPDRRSLPDRHRRVARLASSPGADPGRWHEDFTGLTKTDALVINGEGLGKGQPAWSGLGLMVEGERDPKTLLSLGKMDWDVLQLPLFGALPLAEGQEYNDTLAVDSHVLNVRSDTREILGVVGSSYKPFQNREIVDLILALGDNVVIDTMGTIQGGKRVFFTIRGESFEVRKGDVTNTHLTVCAGHEGGMGVNLFWSGVRVQCKNTMRRAFRGKTNGITIRHEGDMASKVNEAKVALGLMAETTQDAAAEDLALDARTMSTEDVQRFFLEVYSRTESPIPEKPETDAQEKAKAKAVEVIAEWGRLFDEDRQRNAGGATAWTALNAVTEWYDHYRAVKGKGDEARSDNRLYSRLWGLGADRKEEARQVALATL